MLEMKVTRNGQITIPKHIREQLGIQEGTEVAASIEDDRIVIKKKGYDWENHEPIFTEEVKEYIRNIRKDQAELDWKRTHELFNR